MRIKNNLHIPSLLVWVVYPLVFIVLLTFCFISYTGNKHKTRQASDQQITVKE